MGTRTGRVRAGSRGRLSRGRFAVRIRCRGNCRQRKDVFTDSPPHTRLYQIPADRGCIRISAQGRGRRAAPSGCAARHDGNRCVRLQLPAAHSAPQAVIPHLVRNSDRNC